MTSDACADRPYDQRLEQVIELLTAAVAPTGPIRSIYDLRKDLFRHGENRRSEQLEYPAGGASVEMVGEK